MTASLVDHLIAAGAAVAAGAINAVAGGGSLVSFPTLVLLGVPTTAANITNTVALCPGYVGGTLAQRRDLAGQRRRVGRLAAASAIGGLTGAVLLLVSPDRLFDRLVPFLVLGACALLALQDRLKRIVYGGRVGSSGDDIPLHGVAAVGLAAVYGGYFGAGLGIMLLAVLGLVCDDALSRLNALKQLLSAVINWVAAAFFLASGSVLWSLAGVMAVGSLLGGHLGGRVAGRIPAGRLRAVVIAFGIAVAVVQLLR
jgi:uncharacterized membrane protein YfcA